MEPSSAKSESGITINFCNFADYDIVIWAEGLNLIHFYHSMLGGSKEYNPAFLTRSWQKSSLNVFSSLTNFFQNYDQKRLTRDLFIRDNRSVFPTKQLSIKKIFKCKLSSLTKHQLLERHVIGA